MEVVATGTSVIGADADLLRSLLAIAVVFGLLGLGAWALKRGSFGSIGRKHRSLVRIEATVPLGDRRSLMVVAVEGRRLLLGLTPGQVSLVTELIRESTESELIRKSKESDSTPSKDSMGSTQSKSFDAALERARAMPPTS